MKKNPSKSGQGPDPLRPYSSIVLDGPERAPAAPCFMPSASSRKISKSRSSASPPPGAWSRPATCTSTSSRCEAEKGANARRRQGDHLQHHHHFRRHLDGQRRHEIFARLARGHRRFHRNRGRLRGHGRLCGHRRLRQKHARRADGHRAAEPPGGVRLWRHDFARLHHGRHAQAGHRFRVRGRRRAREQEN